MGLLDILRRKPSNTTRVELTGRPSGFSAAISADPWQNDVFRASVDAICRVCAKLQLVPTAVFSDGTTAKVDDRLAFVLQTEWNPFQTGYDGLYQLYAQLLTRNNAYAYVQRDATGRVAALYVLHVTSCEFRADASGRTFCAMTFASGKTALLPYADVIHLKRHMLNSDVTGDSNAPLSSAIRLAETQNRGIEASIENSGRIRGLLTYAGVLEESRIEAIKRRFEEMYLSSGSDGVVVQDSAASFTPVNTPEATVNREDIEATREKIQGYLGISKSIVDSSFTDEQFGAFDESVIEALALQTSLEFTRKLYPGRRDRRIECSTARISYVSMANTVKLLEQCVPTSILSVNEARDMLGLPPLDEDRRLQSLNFASVDIVDAHQLYKAGVSGIKAMQKDEGGADPGETK